ncbi:hypothetical protein [Frankia sp. Cppng1_Ct_nod]|uniref:hypothetical protein n=1 Tax=Frankia sp. Cppng1_Ct_nod TaxID=2897162 RepID=UPI001C3008A7|nr:hypothetical protein [Frankia sp. Cppng1_Ct_nod]
MRRHDRLIPPVKNYVSSILEKLGLTSRTQAAIFAMKRGAAPPTGTPVQPVD